MTLNLLSPGKFVLADWIIIVALNLPAISEPVFYFTQKNFAGGENIPWKMFYRHVSLAPDVLQLTVTIDYPVMSEKKIQLYMFLEDILRNQIKNHFN